MRQATQKMVEECMTYLETLEGKDKLNLIETLREVTEGKVRIYFLFLCRLKSIYPSTIASLE